LTAPSLKDQIEACTQSCLNMDAPLADRLSAMADDVRRLAPQFAEIVDRMVDRLHASEAGASAPHIGEPMPPFVLSDENGHLVSLPQLLEKGKVVVAFHRGHWCPYCRIEADALAHVEQEVRGAGGQLVVITPEVQKFNRQMKAEAHADFPILTDLDSGYALGLDLAIKINDEKRQAMTAAGWDIANYQDNENWILPIPATFVLDRNGIVQGRFVDPDYRKRMDIEEMLGALAGPVAPAAQTPQARGLRS
jgi:peroxiredoxin